MQQLTSFDSDCMHQNCGCLFRAHVQALHHVALRAVPERQISGLHVSFADQTGVVVVEKFMELPRFVPHGETNSGPQGWMS